MKKKKKIKLPSLWHIVCLNVGLTSSPFDLSVCSAALHIVFHQNGLNIGIIINA